MAIALTEVAAGAIFTGMQVGTKELKNRLSHYLQRARDGEAVRVTARGKVIAEIRAVSADVTDDEACLTEMERSGLVTRGQGRIRDITPVKIPAGKTLSEMCIEDRG